MEPKLPAPNIEQLPPHYSRSMEHAAEVSPEVDARQNKERLEQRPEVSVTNEGAPLATPAQITLPVPPQPITPDPTTVVVDDNPIVANDDDLIEREWVDKAKKIIVETKDDPYRREQEVGKLQVDYLRKRYGKELGSPE